jgi:lysophospholipase L1-like esterase
MGIQWKSGTCVGWLSRGALVLGLAMGSVAAEASTLTQNSSWTVNRSGTSTQYRVVAYGDSIYAGYYGSVFYARRRAAPYVAGEYASIPWNADVRVDRRAKSGAVASDIYNNKIIAERSYMQNAAVRHVTFEMCGNDYLQARSSFNGQSGTCNYSVGQNALANCTLYTQLAMQAINQYAPAGATRSVSNLYYPGYDADDGPSNCTDAQTGQPINKQDGFIVWLAQSNWRTCNLAGLYGFGCVDSFAEYMGADYDSNGDTVVDSQALRYVSGESEAAYVQRVTVTLRSTIRDSNFHLVGPSTSYDYLQSDNTHPTTFGTATHLSGLFGFSSGSSAPQFSDAQVVNGRNPVWNQSGHERMGQGVSEQVQ